MIREAVVRRGHWRGPQWLCAYCWLDAWYRLTDRWARR